MSKIMEENYIKAMKPHGNLAGSVDSLRSSIRDLYSLDEDNYRLIKKLQESVASSEKRIAALQRKLSRHRTGAFIGFLSLTGLIIALSHACDEDDYKLQKQIDEIKKTEESDG